MTESTRVLIDMLTTVVLTVGGTIGAYFIALLRRHVSAKTLALAETLARAAADAAWAVAERDGLDKQVIEEDALHRLTLLAARHHIRLTESEWKTLINAALTYRYQDVNDARTTITAPATAIHVTTSATGTTATATTSETAA